jgi:hypothetical protein
MLSELLMIAAIDITQSFQESVAIGVVFENIPPFDSPII